jgi:hypothetical protein
MGFSERSFFLTLYQQTPAALSLVPVPWGDQPNAPKLAYSDAFVTNRATCGKAPCEPDAAAFAAFMTSAATKKYIAGKQPERPAQRPERRGTGCACPLETIENIHSGEKNAINPRGLGAEPPIKGAAQQPHYRVPPFCSNSAGGR